MGKKGFKFKYFSTYKDDENVMPIYIMLPKMSRYVHSFDESKYISFFIKDHELIEKYGNILDKVSNNIKKDLIVNQYTIKNIWKLKLNLMKVKSTQIFMMMDCQKKFFIVFFYQ